MTPTELKAARELLGLSIPEAAEHIGGVSRRSWQYFESDERSIKNDIVEKIQFLLNRRTEILKEVQSKMLHEKFNMASMAVIYYPTPEFCENVLEWRFSQSLARTLHFDYGAKMVVFEPEHYFEWLGDSLDTREKRATWAALQR